MPSTISPFARLAPVSIAALLLTAPLAHADWSIDSSVNTPIATQSGDTVQPKVAPAPGGGSYVSYFDNSGGGYDVWIQRMDAKGNPVWPGNGVQVANLALSSTQDYGLTSDGQGGAVLAFQDDRSGSIKITATRVDQDGNQVWGPTGKTVSVGGSVNSPRASLSADGRIIVGWSRDAVTELQRIELDGTFDWAAPVSLSSAGASMILADLQPGDGTSIIVSMVRQTGFSSPKVLRAQKVDASGALLWPAAHVSVFSTGSLQFGNYPRFVSDGAGGAIFGFYTTGPLQSWVQHVDAAGTILWGTNGIGVTTTTTMERTGPSVAYDPATQRTYIAWEQHTPNTSNYGCYAQSFDAAGTRMWGAGGLALLTTKGNFGVREVEAELFQGDIVFSFVRDIAFNNGTLYASRLDEAGTAMWGGLVTVCGVPSGHSRTEMQTADQGKSLVVIWQDSRDANENIYGDALTADGSLGPASDPADINGDGHVDATDLALVLGAWGPASGSPADVNGDGQVDAADLALVLGGWTG